MNAIAVRILKSFKNEYGFSWKAVSEICNISQHIVHMWNINSINITDDCFDDVNYYISEFRLNNVIFHRKLTEAKIKYELDIKDISAILGVTDFVSESILENKARLTLEQYYNYLKYLDDACRYIEYQARKNVDFRWVESERR